jgi:hypothetical protein
LYDVICCEDKMTSTHDIRRTVVTSGENHVDGISLLMALITARRLLFSAGFVVALAVLYAVIPVWVAAWPTLILTAAYLANWGAAVSATMLPKTFVDNIDKKAVLVTGE